MRTPTVLLLLVVFAGCDSPTGPWAAIDGCYALQGVNGAALPAALPGDTVKIRAGYFGLTAPLPNTEYYGKKVEEYFWATSDVPGTGIPIATDWGLIAKTDTAGVYRLTSLNVRNDTWDPMVLRIDPKGGTLTTAKFWLSFAPRNTCQNVVLD